MKEKCLEQIKQLQEETKELNEFLIKCEKMLIRNHIAKYDENRHEAYDIIDVLTHRIKSTSIILQLNLEKHIKNTYGGGY